MEKKIKTNLLTLLVTIIIMFLLIEIGLRFVLVPASYPIEQVQNSDNSIIGYELKSNIEVIDKGPIVKLRPVTVRTDSQGLREDEDHPLNKPEKTYRIAMVGDSVTFGMYIEQNETFGNIIGKILDKEMPEKVETLNFGVPGYNTQQELEVIKEKVLQYNPDMVIVSFVSNDFSPKAETPFASRIRNIGRHVYIARLIYWVKLKSRKKIIEIPTQEGYQRIDESIKEINKILKNEKTEFILVSIPLYYKNKKNEHYDQHFLELSKEEEFHYCSLINIFKDIPIEQIKIAKEGHPTPLANKIIALKLFECIKEKK